MYYSTHFPADSENIYHCILLSAPLEASMHKTLDVRFTCTSMNSLNVRQYNNSIMYKEVARRWQGDGWRAPLNG